MAGTVISHIRPLAEDDIDAVVTVVIEARVEQGQDRGKGERPEGYVEAIEHSLRCLVADPGLVNIVATCGDSGRDVVGFAIMRGLEGSIFCDTARLQIEALYVASDHRRHGHGHALMRGALEQAELRDCQDIVVLPHSGARAAQRFLARLGFVAVAAHRIIPTQVLARHLAADLPQHRPSSDQQRRRSVNQVIAWRRRVREAGDAQVPADLVAQILDADASVPPLMPGPTSRELRRAVAVRRREVPIPPPSAASKMSASSSISSPH